MTKHLASIFALVLAVAALPSAANAFVAWDESANAQWQGPGYYAVAIGGEAADNPNLTHVMAGRFVSPTACRAAIVFNVKVKDVGNYGCDYFGTEDRFH